MFPSWIQAPARPTRPRPKLWCLRRPRWNQQSLDPLWRQSWRDDIAEIDETAVAILGRPLLELFAGERHAVMQRISRNEKNPQENVDYSFATIKWWVAEAYYTSRIGIHDELQYRGNSFLDEFVGTDVSTALHKPNK